MKNSLFIYLIISLLITSKAYMQQKNIYVWESLDEKTLEYCTISYNDNISVNSYITGVVEELPLHVEYKLIIDKDWQVNFVSVKVITNSAKTITLTGKEDPDKGFIWVNEEGKLLPELNGCNYVDISLTPLTNTLPIRKLSLSENQAHEIGVVYFNVMAGSVKPVKQRYTNLGNNKYRYEGINSNFKAVVEVNDDGFVTQYAEYWRLVTMK